MSLSNSSKLNRRRHYSSKDIISSLPDALLCHILSFLPTQYAVPTSILSTRWRYIWNSIPALDLDDSLRFNSQSRFPKFSFMNFVDRVLNHRDMSICIQKFHLSCGLQCNSSHFNRWISYVIACGVRDLNITFHCRWLKNVHLPPSLFTCNMLEVLRLDMDFHMHFPSLVFLPSLRVFHLISLRFLDDSSVENLIRGCPVLEELVIKRNEDDSFRNLKICSSSLKILKIERNISYGTDCEGSLNIDAPCLEYLDIDDHVSETYNVSKISSLIKASINIWRPCDIFKEECKDFRNSIMELVWGICNVKHLIACPLTMLCVYFGTSTEKPTFCNLTDLEIRLDDCSWDSMYLPELLDCAFKGTDLSLDGASAGWCKHWLDVMPGCMDKCFSRLERIEILRFQGSQNEMEFVKFVLENAIVLKKMTIRSRQMDFEEMSSALKELRRFPRVSGICELVFS